MERCQSLKGATHIDLVCAGTDGEVTREDVLAAGAIVEQLTAGVPWELNDQAQLARDAWRATVNRAQVLQESLQEHVACQLRATRGGRNLIAIGHVSDLPLAAHIDRFDIVPELNAQTGRIELP